MIYIDVPVYLPGYWWHGSDVFLRQWVPVHPDIADGRKRPKYSDTARHRWIVITDLVISVGNQLACKQWSAGTGFRKDYGIATIPVFDDVNLTNTELRIIESWFSKSDAPGLDPWDLVIRNGRHRIWETMPYTSGMPLPILSNALPGFTKSSQNSFTRHLKELDECENFDRSDLLNSHFYQAIATAATGVIPAAV